MPRGAYGADGIHAWSLACGHARHAPCVRTGNGTSQFRGLAPPHEHLWRRLRLAISGATS